MRPSSNNCLSSWQEFEEKFCVSKWIELSIRICDRLLLYFLWFCFVTVAILSSCSRLDYNATPYIAVFFSFLSLYAHLVHEIASVLSERPYWRSVELMATSRRVVSAPLLASCVVFFLSSFFLEHVSTSLYLLVYAFIFDCVVARRVSARADNDVRTFLETLSRTDDNDKISLERKSPGDVIGAENEPKEQLFYREPFELDALEDDCFDEVILSTQRRFLTKDGIIQISGHVRVEIESELEGCVAWISFCPPFESTPKFEYEPIGDDEVAVNLAFVQPYGAKLEVKRRPGTNEANKITFILEYFASTQ